MNYVLLSQDEVKGYAETTGVDMAWPAIIAENDEGEVKGIMATEDREDAVVAGPIMATSGKIAMSMINRYENVLRNLNITTYLFSIERKLNKWIKAVAKDGRAKMIDQTETHMWFRRSL